MISQRLKKIAFSIFSCFCSFYTSCEKVLVSIDSIVHELDGNTSCDISQWANQLSSACKCCLFKQVPLIIKGEKAAISVVNECRQKGYCDDQFIDSFKDRIDLESFLVQLYHNSLVIKVIGKEGITFDAQGNLTERGVKELLEKAYKEKKLTNQDFKSVTCIKVKDIFSEKKGLGTLQLFLINSECSVEPRSYILKEMANKYIEAKKLVQLFRLEGLDNIIWPHHIKGYPSLVIPFTFFQYNNHYLSLAPKALGHELYKFVVDYFLKPTEKNKQIVEQVYFDFGYAIAKLHKHFMKKENGILGLTVIHDDLHYRNVFYDVATRQVTLIDNERMIDSFQNPRSVSADVAFPILSPGRPKLFPKEIFGKVDPASWVTLVAVPFLKGYISAYPQEDWPMLFNELVEKIKSYKRGNNLYEVFPAVMDKQFEILKEYIDTHREELKSLLGKLRYSLSGLAVALQNESYVM